MQRCSAVLGRQRGLGGSPHSLLPWFPPLAIASRHCRHLKEYRARGDGVNGETKLMCSHNLQNWYNYKSDLKLPPTSVINRRVGSAYQSPLSGKVGDVTISSSPKNRT
ncbi:MULTISPECIES: hypothetical protein [unclassified Moorena]|uniref:hypothetical protein n=1 Tax=unclassified Moorena TaxID=2683338 RepID=UPI0014010BD1|nr:MULTISPECIES: hypothetical protein [unclassified Moorena]NEO17850.1 hypothetical protein [Moorena sp. SIO3E8]NEQ04422.1 hypothetical protein [Moorena sp. SIO3F7]